MPFKPFELSTRRYRPIVQWIWDDDPTPARLRQQLESLESVGFGGVCIQPMPDHFRPNDFRRRMKIPYLGQAFFDAIKQTVDIASELGLLVWLYDEGGWPSGQACGLVLEGHAELQGQTLVQEAGRYIVERTGLPDALKAQAMDRFIQLTHEGYRSAVGEHFGKAVEAMFSDELKVPGNLGTDRIPWTDDMPQQFEQRAGYELEPVLGLLFEGGQARKHPANRVLQVRSDYAHVVLDLFIHCYIKPQQDWCHKHGLIFTGHLAGEHDLARHPALFGDYMAVMRCFDMPGVDTIWRQIWHGHNADFPLLAGSARHIHQRAFAMSETGAVYGSDLTPGSLKWVCDHQILRGINRFTLMNLPISGDDESNISALSIDGLPWRAYGPWAKHVALASTLASQGKLVVSAAVLYPGDDLMACGGDGPGTAAQAIVEQLVQQPGGCAFVDEPALMSATTTDAQGQMQFNCGDLSATGLFVAGNSLISQRLADRLLELKEAGVQLVAIGQDQPYFLDEDQAIQRLDCFELFSFYEWVSKTDRVLAIPADLQLYRCSSPGLVTSLRKGDDWQMLLLHNQSAVEVCVELSLPESGWRFDVDTTLQPLGEVKASVVNVPAGAVQAVIWGAVKCDDMMREVAAPLANVNIQSSAWQVVEVKAQSGKLDGEQDGSSNGKMSADAFGEQPIGPWSSNIGRDFSGQITYQAVVDTGDMPGGSTQRLLLDLGQVEYIAQVIVNGRDAGCRAWWPYRFGLTDFLQPGSNTIELVIANTPANHFWSTKNIARRKAQGRWNIYNQRTVERCPPTLGGGLLGPIQWLRQNNPAHAK